MTVRTQSHFTRTLFVCLAALVAPATHAETPDHISVRSLSYSGDGCPSGSARAVIAPDQAAFTLIFDRLAAAAGPDAAYSAEAHCRLIVDLDYPAGWQFAIGTVDFRGFAALDAGTWGGVRTNLRFRGGGQQAPAITILKGPLTQDFTRHEDFVARGRETSPCRPGSQRDIVIDTVLHAHAAVAQPLLSGRALLTMDSIDGGLGEQHQHFALSWRRCQDVAPPRG